MREFTVETFAIGPLNWMEFREDAVHAGKCFFFPARKLWREIRKARISGRRVSGSFRNSEAMSVTVCGAFSRQLSRSILTPGGFGTAPRVPAPKDARKKRVNQSKKK